MRRKLERWLLPSLFALWLTVLLRITVFRPGCLTHGLFSGRVEWVPFVYLATLFRAAAFGFALSLGIELSQFVLGSGVTEVEDLILNTTGAVLGWLAAGFGRKA